MMTDTTRKPAALSGILVACLLAAAPAANAAFLELSPASGSVFAGDDFTLDLRIGGLATVPRQLLGGLNVSELRFDPLRVSYLSAAFAVSEFGEVDPVDPGDDALVGASATGGVLELYAFSVLTEFAALAALQTDGGFRIATLTFRALGGVAAQTELELRTFDASDFAADPLAIDRQTSQLRASISILARDPTPNVPAPATFGLLAAGLLGAFAHARRRVRG